MKKIIFLFIILFLVLPYTVLARSIDNCNFSLLSNLKKIVNNVDITYDHHIVDDNVSFDITIANITEDIYFKINGSDNIYYYSDTNNGVVTISNFVSGTHRIVFYSNNYDCADEKLIAKTINLPYYNKFYNYDICADVPDYKLCQKWAKYDGTYESFRNEVINYINGLDNELNDDEQVDLNFFDKIINFVLKYYYLFFPLFILVTFGVFYLIKYIKFRKNRFDI